MLTSACCVSLPRVAERRTLPLPAPPESFAVATSAAVWRDERRSRDVALKFYVPAARPRSPVVLFSHGIGEDRESYEYFGRALAAAGFLTVHITHVGTDRAVLERGYRHLYRAVKDPQNWIDRTLDVSFVLDRLEDDPRADMGHVAVAGHSAGAFTAFSVAGLAVRESAPPRDPRVRVIIPMSMPRMDGIVPERGYDGVQIPVLNVTGTCDTSILYRTFPRHRRIPFDSTNASGHHLVTIRGVNHDTFSAQSDRHHPLIAAISVAFLRGFLLGDAEAAAWFSETGRQAVLGTETTIERK